MTGTKFKTKEFPFPIDPALKHKLDLLASQLDKNDVWILLDGDEGSGKSNFAAYLLYYFHCITGREFRTENFFFDSDDLFNYAKKTEEKLICWDEMALGGLASEWATKAQRNLMKFAMTGRKKHHVFIMCVPRFHVIKEDLRRDRVHALIHLDLGKNRDEYGKFAYLTRRGIIELNTQHKKTRTRRYNYCVQRGYGFNNKIRIPWVFPEVMNEELYEDMKDRAIESIGEKKPNSHQRLWTEQRNILIKKIAEEKGLSTRKMAAYLEECGVALKQRQVAEIMAS